MADTQLVQFDTARQALAIATSVDEVKDIRDKAEALRQYLRQQGDSLEMQNQCAEIKLRAERRAGEMLAEMDKNPGGQAEHESYLSHDVTGRAPTLPDLGISRMQSSRWQLEASIPEEVFEQHVAEVKARQEELTSRGLLQLGKKRALAAQKAGVAAQVVQRPNAPLLRRQDALAFLAALPDHSVDLLLTDPPYMTDVDDIETFAWTWTAAALPKVKPAGRAYICIGAYPKELSAYLSTLLDRSDMTLTDVLVWTYRNTLGPSPRLDYKRNWQAVLHLRGLDAPALDCPIMTEQFAVQDINAPDGRQGNRYHAWQKPDELAERLIRHSTKPGALIMDCFAGTGTFLLAASKLGRRALGCETSNDMLAIALERGCILEDAN